MDSGFPKNITFEILYFLEWKEFYKILQHNGLNIQEQLKIYVKCNNSLNNLTIDKVCENEIEYLEVVKYLHSIGAECTVDAMYHASRSGAFRNC